MSTPEEVAFRLSLKDRAKFSAEARAASRDMEGMGKSAERAGRKARSSSTSWRALSSATKLGLLALGGTSLVAGVGAGALGLWGLKLINLKEQAKISFTTMLGSAKMADQFVTSLQTFAAKTPFEFPDVLTGAQRLLAMGFAAKEILPTLTAVGDATSALGASPETINRIIIALGQMRSKGKVQAEEMMQLTEAGIPAWDILARKMGKTIPQVMKMVTKGQVNAMTAIGALTTGMEEKFGGLMAKQSNTLQGLWSTAHDVGQAAAAALVEPFVPDIKRGMREVIDIFSDPGNQRSIQRFAHGLRHDIGEGIDFIRSNWHYVKDGFNAARPTLIDVGNTAINVGKNLFEIGKVAVETVGPPMMNLGRQVLPLVRKGLHGIDKGIQFIADHKKQLKEFFQPFADAMVAAAFGAQILNSSLDLLGKKIDRITGPLSRLLDMYNKAKDIFPSFDFHGIHLGIPSLRDAANPFHIQLGPFGFSPFSTIAGLVPGGGSGGRGGGRGSQSPNAYTGGVPASGVIFTPSRQEQQSRAFQAPPGRQRQPAHVHVHVGGRRVGSVFIQDVADQNARTG